jgi:hypothetical protein
MKSQHQIWRKIQIWICCEGLEVKGFFDNLWIQLNF